MTRHDLFFCFGNAEPSGAIHLNERLGASASWRPFQRETVALQHVDIEIAFGGESGDALAAPLSLCSERQQLAEGIDVSLLPELPSGSSFRGLAIGIFALRNAPGTSVPFAPERAAGSTSRTATPSDLRLNNKIPALRVGIGLPMTPNDLPFDVAQGRQTARL